jgi:hypothetical protein
LERSVYERGHSIGQWGAVAQASGTAFLFALGRVLGADCRKRICHQQGRDPVAVLAAASRDLPSRAITGHHGPLRAMTGRTRCSIALYIDISI